MTGIDSCGTGLREKSRISFCSYVSIRIVGTLGLEYSGCMFFPVVHQNPLSQDHVFKKVLRSHSSS